MIYAHPLPIALIREAVISIGAHDDVVQHPNVKISSRMANLVGDLFICFGRSQVSGGMVVAEDQADRFLFQRFFQDDPRIGHRSGHAS